MLKTKSLSLKISSTSGLALQSDLKHLHADLEVLRQLVAKC